MQIQITSQDRIVHYQIFQFKYIKQYIFKYSLTFYQFRSTNTMNNLQTFSFRTKLFFVSNELRFFNIRSYAIVVFYFFILNLALISTLDDVSYALNADHSIALNVLVNVNNYFFFFTIPPFDGSSNSDMFNIIVTVMISTLLAIYTYCLLGIDLNPKVRKTNRNRKSLTIIKVISLNFIYGSILYGSFCVYYIGKLFLSSWPYLIVVPTGNLVGIVLINYAYEEFSNEGDYTNFSELSMFYHQNQSKISICKLLFKVSVASLGLWMAIEPILISTYLVFFVLDLFDLRYIVTRKRYLDSRTQKIKQLWLSFELSIQTCNIFSLLFGFGIIVNNFTVMVPTMTLLGCCSLQVYRNYRDQALLLGGVAKIENEGDAILLMYEYFSLVNDPEHKKELIFQGLIRQHVDSCSNCNCFCKNDIKTSLTQYQKGHLKLKFVLMKLLQILQKYSFSFMVMTIYLHFRISFMNSFTKSSIDIQKFNNRNKIRMSNGQKFLIYQLEQEIRIKMQDLNQDLIILNPNIVFTEDLLLSKLHSNLVNINDKNIDKYSKLETDFFTLNEIELICAQITEMIRLIEELWLQFKASHSHNLKIYETFLIYYEYMIQSKPEVLYIKNTILSKLTSMSHLKIADTNNIKQFIYTSRACVIQSFLTPNGLSPITNISKSCLQLFQTTAQILKGKDIHIIMANFLSVPHREVIKNWIESDTINSNANGIASVFFADNFNNCFKGKGVLKVHSLGLDLRLYKIIVKENEDDYLLLNNRFEIQSCGRRLIAEKLFDLRHFTKKMDGFCGLNLEQLMKENDQIRRTMVINNSIIRNIQTEHENLNESDEDEIRKSNSIDNNSQKDPFIFQSSVTVNKQLMGKTIYYSLKFGEIKRQLNLSRAHLGFDKRERNKVQKVWLPKTQGILENATLNETKESFEIDEDSPDFGFAINNISQGQSLADESIDLKFSRILQKVKRRTIKYKQYWNANAVISSIIIFFLITVIICSFFLQTYMFSAGMRSVNDLNQAAMAVTDNFQLLKISYNSLLMSKIYCLSSQQGDIEKCYLLQQSASFTLNQVYNRFLAQLFAYDTNITSGIKVYEALELPIMLRLGTNYQSVSIRDFMQNYYFALREADQGIEANLTNISPQTTSKFAFLFQNLEKLEQISFKSTEFYQTTSISEISVISTQMYIMTAFFIISALGLIIAIGINFIRQFQKRERYMKIYTLIPPSNSVLLKQFTSNINRCISHGYESLELLLPNEEKSRVSKDTFKFKSNNYTKTILLIIFITLQVLNIANLVNLSTVLSPAQSVVTILSNLIISQNNSLQNYFQLKTFFLQYNFSKQFEQISTQLKVHLNQTEIGFVTDLRSSIELFQSLDQTFSQDLENLILQDACNQTISGYPDWFIQQCSNSTNYNILQKGVVAGWTYLQRNSMKALIDLENDLSIDRANYFKKQIYQTLDNYIYFLFKMCHKVQQRILLELQICASLKEEQAQLIQLSILLVIIVIITAWQWKCRQDNQAIGYLYGAILQLPHKWLAQNTIAIKFLDDQLNIG